MIITSRVADKDTLVSDPDFDAFTAVTTRGPPPSWFTCYDTIHWFPGKFPERIRTLFETSTGFLLLSILRACLLPVGCMLPR
jgi:hypothetical protein